MQLLVIELSISRRMASALSVFVISGGRRARELGLEFKKIDYFNIYIY